MLVSKVTSRCLLMVIWAQPHSLMWLGPIGVHVHMYVKLLLGSSVPSIGFLKKTYMVMNSNLMTTIVSIASVRWLAVVVFSLGRNSLYAYTLRERLTFRWTLLDWKFSWNKQNSLLTCKHVCSWFLAWRLWHCPVALSYTVTRISCIKGTLLRKSLHDNFAFHSQVVGGSIDSNQINRSIGNFDCNSVVPMKKYFPSLMSLGKALHKKATIQSFRSKSHDELHKQNACILWLCFGRFDLVVQCLFTCNQSNFF